MVHQLNVYLLILLPSMVAHLCWCVRYNNYEEYSLENHHICNPLNKAHTHEIRNATAAIVKSKRFFEHWSNNYNRQCKFTFKTAKGEGLFVVIQKMFFRRNDTTDSCLDYVQFKRSDGHQTNKFCGSIDRSLPYFAEGFFRHDNTYSEFEPINDFTKTGKLETEIFISKESVLSGQTLDLKIIYTPYRKCSNIADKLHFKEFDFDSCIRREYICDGIQNCHFAVCSDEANCPPNTDVLSREDNTTEVTVGAVTTVILCFIIFVMCLWICKRSQKLCWSSDCAGPNVCSRPGSLPPDADGPASRAVPTAPMLEVVVSSPVADKDLPPSYDSLFPEQSNPARS